MAPHLYPNRHFPGSWYPNRYPDHCKEMGLKKHSILTRANIILPNSLHKLIIQIGKNKLYLHKLILNYYFVFMLWKYDITNSNTNIQAMLYEYQKNQNTRQVPMIYTPDLSGIQITSVSRYFYIGFQGNRSSKSIFWVIWKFEIFQNVTKWIGSRSKCRKKSAEMNFHSSAEIIFLGWN